MLIINPTKCEQCARPLMPDQFEICNIFDYMNDGIGCNNFINRTYDLWRLIYHSDES